MLPVLQGSPIALLFEVYRQGTVGKAILLDGRREVRLAVRRRNVVGIKGLPELWDRLGSPVLDVRELRGHLLQDIPRILAAGIPIDRIFEEASGRLGRFLARLASSETVATFREIPEPDTTVVGLPDDLMTILLEGLRTWRSTGAVRKAVALDLERPLAVDNVGVEVLGAVAPEAVVLLDEVGKWENLAEWVQHIDGSSRGRQQQFWRSLDLVLQIGALELVGSPRNPLKVRRVREEDVTGATPSGFSVAPDVPQWILDLEAASVPSDDSRRLGRTAGRKSEKFALDQDEELFALPPDPDESSYKSRSSGTAPSRGTTAPSRGLDDHDEVFALPPDEDAETEPEDDDSDHVVRPLFTPRKKG